MASIVLLPSWMTPDDRREYVRASNAEAGIVATGADLIAGLSPAALAGINEARRRIGFPPLDGGSVLAGLVEFLRETADDPAVFPKGKWATIQHVESLLAAANAERGGAQ